MSKRTKANLLQHGDSTDVPSARVTRSKKVAKEKTDVARSSRDAELDDISDDSGSGYLYQLNDENESSYHKARLLDFVKTARTFKNRPSKKKEIRAII